MKISHYWTMILCCLIPVAVVLIAAGTGRSYWSIALLLLCPISMLAMGFIHKDNCCAKPEERKK